MWLWSWFQRKSNEDTSVYQPKERKLYTYFNGSAKVRADPMVLFKKLMANGLELTTRLKVAMSPMKDANKAHDEAVAQIRDVFSVKPWSEGGLTEIETLRLMDHFLIYTETIKKNSSPSPIPPQVISDPLETSLPGGPPTLNSLDSGSTATAPSTELPIRSTSELP